MKKYLLLICIVVFISSQLQSEDYSNNDNENSELIHIVDQLIADRQYQSAFELLNSSTNNSSVIVAKQVDILINYFVTSIMHTMFALKDLEPDEDLDELRQSSGNFDMVLFDPPKVIEPLLKNNPNDGILTKALGDYYYDAQNRYGDDWLIPVEESLKKAYENYKISINSGYEDFLSYGNAAHYLLTIQENEKAKKYLLKSLELKADYANTHNNLAYAYIQLGETEKALNEAVTAADLYNDMKYKYDAYIMAGRLSFDLGGMDNAILFFKKAKAIFKDSYETINYLMKLYLSIKDIGNADLMAKELFGMYPKNTNSYKMIMQNYYDAGVLEDFVGFITSLEPNYNDLEISGNLFYYKGFALITLGRREEGIVNLQKAGKKFEKVFEPDHQVFSEISRMISQ